MRKRLPNKVSRAMATQYCFAKALVPEATAA
jgi:hypothetical protein